MDKNKLKESAENACVASLVALIGSFVVWLFLDGIDRAKAKGTDAS
jgi:hypothetical protein